ncbi:maleylpyruvate isomerase family mycothiol-dependent enzyme [Propionibacteriaceae bacterium G1746]|uniref:maleylpyruvate isomerase family mycothiol-dependent enzyme n=1 Tax=Aestuariimicrobium sp. G57 TaxID=3418485 RepID=UPI003C17CB09
MDAPGSTEGDHAVALDVAAVRHRKMEATQHLLGATIRLSDQEWQAPSLLPGWTRAHVATHLARNADGLRRVLRGYLDGLPVGMYDSEQQRERQIERGSERQGLDLQIDLDTSAGALSETMAEVLALPRERLADGINLRPGITVPVGFVPLARLSEVVLHCVDLGVGYRIRDIEPDIARWALEWHTYRLADRDTLPVLEITSSSGLKATIGQLGEPTRVQGSDRDLVGWLTGRSDGSGVAGSDDVVLPLVG